jgi:hypothetical protein
LYVKSNELKKWADEKNYINEIHYKFFKDADTICRVEVKAKSKAINKRNLDICDILISEKHPSIFQSLLADKLKFNDITTRYHDESRNPKFHSFELIESKWFKGTSIVSVPIRTSKTTHRNHCNKFQNMVYMYLDDEHSVHGVISFYQCNIWNSPVSKTKYCRELEKVIKNHKGKLNKKKQDKIKFIKKLLESEGEIM